ncbi:calcium-binding protein [Tropicimonas aquimaris]|uniref:Calcium-binding protein n=1 Tax=Tropicimonas aquimaris TaxID=914152 RepID=A0ABW3IU50_9RHOB
MFEGTKARLQVFIPDMKTPSSRAETRKIDEDAVEFDDVSFLDINGDPYFVVAARFDLTGTTVHYETLQGGVFANVDDETGFNGYKLTMTAFAEDDQLSLRGASLVGGTNSLELPDANVETRGNAIWINVDGLFFSTGDGFDLRLNLKFDGDGGRDVFLGGDGKDLVVGRGGADVLAGGNGRDSINGGKGSDLIDGGAGRDMLTGGRGGDTFVFGDYRGRDTITDFDVARDKLLVVGEAERFRDIDISNTRDGALVTAGAGKVLLEDVRAGELEADMFLF